MKSTSSILLWHFAVYSPICHCMAKSVDCLVSGQLFILKIQTGQCWPFPSVLWYLDDGKELSTEKHLDFTPELRELIRQCSDSFSICRTQLSHLRSLKILKFSWYCVLKNSFTDAMFWSSPWKGTLMARRVVQCHHCILYKLGDIISGEYMLYSWIKLSKKQITKKNVYSLEQYYRAN